MGSVRDPRDADRNGRNPSEAVGQSASTNDNSRPGSVHYKDAYGAELWSFAERLDAHHIDHVGVISMALAGNRLLFNSAGPTGPQTQWGQSV